MFHLPNALALRRLCDSFPSLPSPSHSLLSFSLLLVIFSLASTLPQPQKTTGVLPTALKGPHHCLYQSRLAEELV